MLFDKFREELKAKRHNNVKGKQVASLEQDRYIINVPIGQVEAVSRNDTGTDTTIIAEKLLTKIISGSPSVEVKEFDSPLDM